MLKQGIIILHIAMPNLINVYFTLPRHAKSNKRLLHIAMPNLIKGYLFNRSQTLCLFKHQTINQHVFNGINCQKALQNWQLFNLANSIYQADNESSAARRGLQKRRKKSHHNFIPLESFMLLYRLWIFSVLITRVFLQFHKSMMLNELCSTCKMIIKLIYKN